MLTEYECSGRMVHPLCLHRQPSLMDFDFVLNWMPLPIDPPKQLPCPQMAISRVWHHTQHASARRPECHMPAGSDRTFPSPFPAAMPQPLPTCRGASALPAAGMRSALPQHLPSCPPPVCRSMRRHDRWCIPVIAEGERGTEQRSMCTHGCDVVKSTAALFVRAGLERYKLLVWSCWLETLRCSWLVSAHTRPPSRRCIASAAATRSRCSSPGVDGAVATTACSVSIAS